MKKSNIENELTILIQKVATKICPGRIIADLCLDIPQNPSHGDLSSNIALRLSKHLKKNPRSIAESFIAALSEKISESSLENVIDKIQIAGPGFINFFIKDQYYCQQINQIIKEGDSFGKINIGKSQQVQIEFVSANPTGPLSVAHARQAAVGDSLARIMEFLGFKVIREYYLNDKGNQIKILGRSIELRLKELEGKNIEFPEDHYQGDYIKDIAKDISASQRSLLSRLFSRKRKEKRKQADFSNYGVTYILSGIKKDLADFGVKFGVWFSQKALEETGKIDKAIGFLSKKGFVYNQDGATWFKSTSFGDDKDRVIIKSDKAYTYLAPDIAYHKDKFERGFKRVINLWGPDHHGYIPRISAAVSALGYKKESFSVVIVQLVSLFRQGKPIAMSTRKGTYVTLRQIIDEIGKDVARFLLVSRRVSSQLDFDLELAKKHSSENPAYYIQYAFARISSILRKSNSGYRRQSADLSLLISPEELLLIRKLIQFPYSVRMCFNILDPYPLTMYLLELASAFHKFYDKYKVLDSSNLNLSRARVNLVRACATVFKNGLLLLGLSSPERM